LNELIELNPVEQVLLLTVVVAERLLPQRVVTHSLLY